MTWGSETNSAAFASIRLPENDRADFKEIAPAARQGGGKGLFPVLCGNVRRDGCITAGDSVTDPATPSSVVSELQGKLDSYGQGAVGP
jgi:hypothetical protein